MKHQTLSSRKRILWIDWKRGAPYVWTNDDKEQIMSSDDLFARKFSTAKDKQIIDYIKENI